MRSNISVMSAIGAANPTARWVRGNRVFNLLSGTPCPPCSLRVSTRITDSCAEERPTKSSTTKYPATCSILMIGFGFDPAVCVLFPVRKHRFKGERHSLFHDEAHKCLHTCLGEKLPARIAVAQFLCPWWKSACRHICGRKNGGSDAIGVDQGNLQLRREPFVPKCGFTAAIVARENEGGGFAKPGGRRQGFTWL